MKIAHETKLYKLDLQAQAESPGYEYVLANYSLKICELITSSQELIYRFLLQGKTESQIVALLCTHTGHFEVDYVKKTLNNWQKIGLIKPKKHLFKFSPWLTVASISNFKLLNYLARQKLLAVTFFMTTSAVSICGVYYLLANQNYVAISYDTLVLISLAWFCLALHELGHLMALTVFNLPAHKIGFSLYFGLPLLFVDATSSWSLGRFKRILVSLAGPFINLSIFLCCKILMALFPMQATLFFLLGNINLFMLLLSLLPFLKMDGYYVVSDLLHIPNLQQKTLNIIKQDYQHPKHKFVFKNIWYYLYFVSYIVCGVLLTIYAANFWWQILV